MTSEGASDPIFGPAVETSGFPKRTRSVHQLLSSGPPMAAESISDPELGSLALEPPPDESNLFRLDGALAAMRRVPFQTTRHADSAPAWSAGLRVERQVGPIIDRLG
ncbi:hypothetical protein P7L87_24730, partial [Vibrio parahaemolyticus]|nr:hypothetical protein [Vibrio parahaemolyticus]